jgi:hypothetical protein
MGLCMRLEVGVKRDRITSAEYLAMKPRSKYRNKKTTIDGIAFDSVWEAQRYSELAILQKAGEIKNLRLQVVFELIPKQPSERAVKYIADFVYEQDGLTIVEDTKSQPTRKKPDYVIKRKLFKMRYPDMVFMEVVK